MLPRQVMSLQHPIVKHLTKLRKSSSYRNSCQTAIVPGKKLAYELSKHFPIKTLLFTKEAEIPLKAESTFLVNEKIIKKITGLENPEGILAEIPLPKQKTLHPKRFLIAFDGIQDPGNLGTLLRTALAMGAEGAYLLNGTVDPFNEKAIRAAKGASFLLPLEYGTAEDLKTFIKKNHLHLYFGDMKGADAKDVPLKFPLIILLGSEAKGPQKLFKEIGTPLAIPMTKNVESLNVAVAGGILMYLAKNA